MNANFFYPVPVNESKCKTGYYLQWGSSKKSTSTMLFATKGQIKPKVDWCTVNSPKKAFLLFLAKTKTNCFACFLGESTERQSDFGFIWPSGYQKAMLSVSC